jgi:hypothetical protein
LAFSTAPFCQEAYASQNHVVMAQALASRPCRANAVSLSRVIEDRSRGSSRRNTAIITATVSAADLPARRAASTVDRGAIDGLALLEDQHRPRAPANQEVALPMARLTAPPDLLGPVVDGTPLRDHIARLTSPPAAPPGTPARQQPPELLGFLPGAVNEGVDGLERDGAEPALLAALEPAGDLLRRPPLQQALAHEAAEPRVALEDGRALAALAVAALGVDRQVA